MSRKLLLDIDGENGADQNELKINENYAERYDKWRRLEEMQKLKDRYGDDGGESFSDDGTSSGDDVVWSKTHDIDFLKTLSALKSRDPRIYTDMKFFDCDGVDEQRSLNNSAMKLSRVKSNRPMYLKDYERKLVIEKNGEISDDDGNEQVTHDHNYYHHQQQIKDEMRAALSCYHDYEDNEEPLFSKRVKTVEEKKKEDEEYVDWLKGQLDAKGNYEELNELKKYWNSPNLDSDEIFLRDYLLERLYQCDEIDGPLDHESMANLDEEERELEREREFEVKYNFRFEEPDQEFIKQYPRTVKQSLRKSDDRRKLQRLTYKERKEQDKVSKKAEIRELKSMKKKEIEEKLKKLRELSGDYDISITIDDLESDFDPVKYDERMKELYGEKYYDKGDQDEEKPCFSGLSDSSTEEDYDNLKVNTEDFCDPHQNEDVSTECAGKDERCREKTPPRRKRKRNSEFRNTLIKRKPFFDPSEKTFEEYFNQYYALNYEDVIADGFITRFKYRNVPANNFGLTVEEILQADDRQLNAWVSLKKAAAYRSDAEEAYDIQAYARKALNIDKKVRIFSTDFGGSKSGKLTEDVEKDEKDIKGDNKQNGCYVKETKLPSGKGLSKNKKRKQKKLLEKNQNSVRPNICSATMEKSENRVGEFHGEHQLERRAKNEDIKCEDGKKCGKKRTKKKNRKFKVIESMSGIDDERLRAYGLNPKKFRNKMHYKNLHKS